MKFVEIFYPKNWLRFLKKGVTFAILLAILHFLTKIVLGMFGIVLNAQTFKEASSLPGKTILILLSIIIV